MKSLDKLKKAYTEYHVVVQAEKELVLTLDDNDLNTPIALSRSQEAIKFARKNFDKAYKNYQNSF